jgi:outer membrane protein OmpA-like peptidoglycan-associated protein
MRLAAIFIALSLVSSGCAFRHDAPTDVHRQWGLCTVLGAVTGGVIGAGVSYAIAAAISNAKASQPVICPPGGAIPVGGLTCTLVGINAQSQGLNVSSGSKSSNDRNKNLSLLGAIPGAIVGGLAGHYLCDPVVEAAPPPLPPPPPPPPALPPPPAVVKAPPERLVLRGVHFDFDKYDIRPESEVILDEAAATLKRRPDLRVEVNGYCDIIGSDSYNLRLSERRANAVRQYLVAQGISPDRLSAHGYGKTNFVASNDTDEGRAQNRRVELLPIGGGGA